MAERHRTILITRQADQSGEFVAEVEARGWRPVVIPMIQISEPENWGECDGALAAAGSHDAIIFTSANAVAGCCDRYETLYGASLGRAGLAVYAVGDNTKIALRKRGVETTYVPGSFSGRSLVEYFETQDIEGRKFLLPRGNLGAPDLPDGLRELGGEVTTFEVYRNSPPPASAREDLRTRFLSSEFDVATFASPSAVWNFADAVAPELFARIQYLTKTAVIGPTTGAAAREAGFRVDIKAKTYTSAGIVQAIEEYYTHHQNPKNV